MAKFKVGDKVRRIKSDNHQFDMKVGDISFITGIVDTNISLQDYGSGEIGDFDLSFFELVEEKEEGITLNTKNINEVMNNLYKKMTEDYMDYPKTATETMLRINYDYKPKQTIMSKITNFAKNLTLSADEKLLRKYELHDENGDNTDEACKAIREKFYNTPENQAFLLELAKGMELEEKNK